MSGQGQLATHACVHLSTQVRHVKQKLPLQPALVYHVRMAARVMEMVGEGMCVHARTDMTVQPVNKVGIPAHYQF